MAAKQNKRHIEGKPYFFWDYEEQTKVKHSVLAEYYQVWETKLGAYNQTRFFDCFGGCGAYLDAKNNEFWGSPFLIAEIASRAKNEKKRNPFILAVEPDDEAYKNLLAIKNELTGRFSVLPEIRKMTFEDLVKEEWVMSKYMSDKEATFFFIDPFGFSIKYDDIASIMDYPKNEIIINFMFDHISRFIGKEDSKLENTYTKFFGCDKWKEAINLSGDERESMLVDIYKSQLKKRAKYVFPYRLSFPERDRTYYYLFHVTNNRDGCSIMKSAFAKVNAGRVEYLGRKGDAISMHDLDNVRIGVVKEYLKNKYPTGEKTFTEIIEENIDDTLYQEKEFRQAIKELKEEGGVRITPVTSKTGRGLSGDDIVSFTGEFQEEFSFRG